MIQSVDILAVPTNSVHLYSGTSVIKIQKRWMDNKGGKQNRAVFIKCPWFESTAVIYEAP